MITKRKSLLYRNVFEKVIGPYAEFKSIQGTLSCESLYKSIASQNVGKSSFNTSVVRPTPIDFIADVERLAEQWLTDEEYAQFKDIYMEQVELPVPLPKSHLKQIKEEMGKAFLDAEIHPIELYFKPRDTR